MVNFTKICLFLVLCTSFSDAYAVRYKSADDLKRALCAKIQADNGSRARRELSQYARERSLRTTRRQLMGMVNSNRNLVSKPVSMSLGGNVPSLLHWLVKEQSGQRPKGENRNAIARALLRNGASLDAGGSNLFETFVQRNHDSCAFSDDKEFLFILFQRYEADKAPELEDGRCVLDDFYERLLGDTEWDAALLLYDLSLRDDITFSLKPIDEMLTILRAAASMNGDSTGVDSYDASISAYEVWVGSDSQV